MKYVIPILTLFCFAMISQAIAEPESYEDFMKWYGPLVDTTNEYKLSPTKQLDIGILMPKIICFDDKVRILKTSKPNFVACVNQDTLQKLIQREWGIAQYDPDAVSNSHPVECSIVWKFTFDKEIPNESSLVKSMKLLMLDYSELILWQPMTITHYDDELEISWNGSFRVQEISDIRQSLKSSYDSLTNVEVIQGGCV